MTGAGDVPEDDGLIIAEVDEAEWQAAAAEHLMGVPDEDAHERAAIEAEMAAFYAKQRALTDAIHRASAKGDEERRLRAACRERQGDLFGAGA